MSFRLVPKSVTLNDVEQSLCIFEPLGAIYAVLLRLIGELVVDFY